MSFPFAFRARSWSLGAMKRDSRAGPDLSLERAAMIAGARIVAGIDEAGRGPLAGPVTAAAVILDPARTPEGINDCKKLSPARREALHDMLVRCAHVSVAHASVEEIDRFNILQAAHLAMRRALAGLDPVPDFALIDGNLLPRDLSVAARAVVGGDGLSLSIAAASIVAKVRRDRIMRDLAQHFPGYGWETNAGYGTKGHIAALRDLGVTPYHRRSFRPVHNILYQEKSITL